MSDNPSASPEPVDNGSKVIVSLFKVLAIFGIIALLIALLLPARRCAREPARRTQCKNNLRQIALALYNYADAWHALPPAYTVDADGKPLHSWRTLILPYVDQAPLYNSIDLTKSWDDPVNAEAFKQFVPVYRCPSIDIPRNHTTYRAIVAPGSCFRPTEPRHMSEVTDGASQTLMVIEVEAKHSIPWMAPTDADESMLLGMGPKTGLPHNGGMHGLLVDGNVRLLSAELPATHRRALISISGKETVLGADGF